MSAKSISRQQVASATPDYTPATFGDDDHAIAAIGAIALAALAIEATALALLLSWLVRVFRWRLAFRIGLVCPCASAKWEE